MRQGRLFKEGSGKWIRASRASRVSMIPGLLFVLIFAGSGSVSRAEPRELASPVPSTGPSSSPSPVPQPVATISRDEAKTLLREFNRALHAELGALKHRQDFEWKELRASQAARKREWEAAERQARKEFFAAHEKGAERRAYIKDFIARRNNLFKMLADQKRQRQGEQKVRRKSLEQDQATRIKEFHDFLKRSERPPEYLWPRPGI